MVLVALALTAAACSPSLRPGESADGLPPRAPEEAAAGPASEPGPPSQSSGRTPPPAAPTEESAAARGLEALPPPDPIARPLSPDPFSYRKLLGRDGINPVYAPEHVPAAEADYAPDELVLGVCVQDDCRAYPIGVLNWREMVNDEVGGIPILATW